MSIPKIKEVVVSKVLNGKQTEETLVVVKMPLGTYAEFLLELKKIPATIEAIVKMALGEKVSKDDLKEAAVKDEIDISAEEEITTNDLVDIVFKLPEILHKHWGDLVNLLSIASGVPKKDLDECDLDEATVVIMAVIEVNNFFGIGDRYREFLNRKQDQRMTVPKKKK